MNKDMTISDVLSYKAEELRRSLGLDLPHPTSQGDLGEDAWISFLESFLPSRYAVSKGFVFDSHGGISDQIDVIIYDRHHSPLILKTPNDERYVTAESVYAVFEVKPEADEGNIRYALDKINSVRDLHRTSREMVASGRLVEPRKLTRIIGGLLTKDSISEESVRKHLRTYDGVDMVCAASAMTAFRRSSGRIEISDEREALPAFFYLLLDELHKLGTVAAIDIREYAGLALKSFRLEGDRHVSE
ncbi:hypothetical protein H6A18_10795 [Collinsella tanakaei]|uniref:DUF6602 domain-containing protein n=1 Tax=Collinsella tanakaei TaxID=626935 RepID=UPI00195BDE0D|nr:DUF6602 domain-containing protein [Collinsella tanakaei]MBM6756987.1 hypothetical protein [Collinsella tanakaei]